MVNKLLYIFTNEAVFLRDYTFFFSICGGTNQIIKNKIKIKIGYWKLHVLNLMVWVQIQYNSRRKEFWSHALNELWGLFFSYSSYHHLPVLPYHWRHQHPYYIRNNTRLEFFIYWLLCGGWNHVCKMIFNYQMKIIWVFFK